MLLPFQRQPSFCEYPVRGKLRGWWLLKGEDLGASKSLHVRKAASNWTNRKDSSALTNACVTIPQTSRPGNGRRFVPASFPEKPSRHGDLGTLPVFRAFGSAELRVFVFWCFFRNSWQRHGNLCADRRGGNGVAV